MADHQWRIVQFYKLFLSADGRYHQCESFMSRVERNNQFASLCFSLQGALQLLQHISQFTMGHGHEVMMVMFVLISDSTLFDYIDKVSRSSHISYLLSYLI